MAPDRKLYNETMIRFEESLKNGSRKESIELWRGLNEAASTHAEIKEVFDLFKKHFGVEEGVKKT